MRPERVWYVAYGSNVNRDRFLRYLEGDDDHAGARDRTPPARSEWGSAPLRLRFAGESRRWRGGGVAFVDPDPAATAFVRAWDITSEQFEDVFAQENRRPVGSALDWATILRGETEVGTSWYRRVVPLELSFADAAFANGPIANQSATNSVADNPLAANSVAELTAQPALTFTWSVRLAYNPPHSTYAETIASGLAEHPELTRDEIAAYLARGAI